MFFLSYNFIFKRFFSAKKTGFLYQLSTQLHKGKTKASCSWKLQHRDSKNSASGIASFNVAFADFVLDVWVDSVCKRVYMYIQKQKSILMKIKVYATYFSLISSS